MNHSGSYYGATAVRKVTDLDREQARKLGDFIGCRSMLCGCVRLTISAQ